MGDNVGHPFRGNQWTEGYTFVVSPGNKKLAEISKPRLGVALTEEHVAALAGAPPGSKVEIRIQNSGVLRVETKLPDRLGDSLRYIDMDAKKIENSEFNVAKRAQGKGIGLDVFSRQVDEARAYGFERLTTFASGGGNNNGYYTWARFGYDGDVIGPDGKHTLVSKIMAQPRGAEWWMENGKGFQATFHLDSGSTSMRVLREYQRLKREEGR